MILNGCLKLLESQSGLLSVSEPMEVSFRDKLALLGLLKGRLSDSLHGFETLPGQVLLASPGSVFHLIPRQSSYILVLLLSPMTVLEYLKGSILYAGASAAPFDGRDLLKEMVQIAKAPGEEQGAYLSASAMILVLQYLARWENGYFEKPQKLAPGLTPKQQATLARILNDIHSHALGSISLSSAAQSLGFTPQYLSSFFKKSTGFTFMQYIQKLQCEKAHAYLEFTTLSSEEICQKVGLHQREILDAWVNEHPSTRQTTSIGSLCAEHALKNPLDHLELLAPWAASVRRNSAPLPSQPKLLPIHCAAAGTPFPPIWSQLINLGYVSDFRDSRSFAQLVRLQKEIGFRYGRICRLFDFVTDYTVQQKKLYDYSRIFRILDVMIENHILPFIELGNKLFRLQFNLQENIAINARPDSCAYFDQMVEFLPGFIRACINRYGQESFDQWRFEFSYTNYDFNEAAEDFPLAKYARYFQKIQRILRTYSPKCAIGGPGFNYWGSPERILDILKLLESYQSLPDFATAYLYPLTKDDSSSSLSSDPDLARKRVAVLKQYLHSHYPEMELWITEFNSNISSRSLLNDSCYQSLFLAKNLTELARLGVKAAGYYLMSDLSLRYADTLDFFFGGWGLFSDSGIPKPSYYTYCLLSSLGSELLGAGKTYFITKDCNRQYSCLFFNYAHIAPAFYQKNVTVQDLKDEASLFVSVKEERFLLRFDGLRPGRYFVREYTISPENGSLLKIWKQLGFSSLTDPRDLKTLEQISSLRPHFSVQEATMGSPLELDVPIAPQELKLLVLYPTDAVFLPD